MIDIGLLDGLNALSEAAFPKVCSCCGRHFESFENFVADTERIRGLSGLQEGVGEQDDEVIVELYRNCPCGSTLMDFFMDRRDRSIRGLKRRALFDKVLQQLVSSQVDEEVARAELLKFMHGKESALLKERGISSFTKK